MREGGRGPGQLPSQSGSGAGVGMGGLTGQRKGSREALISLYPISASEGEIGEGMPMRPPDPQTAKMWRFITESK